MTPREALKELEHFILGIDNISEEAYKVLESIVLASEQAPTLEKLGWKWYKNDFGWISFFDKQRRVSIHIPSKKVRIECEPSFDEILALAEVIKEMEDKK